MNKNIRKRAPIFTRFLLLTCRKPLLSTGQILGSLLSFYFVFTQTPCRAAGVKVLPWYKLVLTQYVLKETTRRLVILSSGPGCETQASAKSFDALGYGRQTHGAERFGTGDPQPPRAAAEGHAEDVGHFGWHKSSALNPSITTH